MTLQLNLSNHASASATAPVTLRPGLLSAIVSWVSRSTPRPRSSVDRLATLLPTISELHWALDERGCVSDIAATPVHGWTQRLPTYSVMFRPRWWCNFPARFDLPVIRFLEDIAERDQAEAARLAVDILALRLETSPLALETAMRDLAMFARLHPEQRSVVVRRRCA